MKRTKPKYRQIVDAAVIVIAENGYHQAQVSKIAKEAGVADGTIYLYFKNKEDILISVFRDKLAIFVENIKEILKKDLPIAEKLQLVVENHFRILEEDHHLAIVTQLELRQSNKDLRLQINNVLKEYTVLLDILLEEGVEKGELSPELDLRLARQMLFGTMDETITSWVMNEQKFNLVNLAPKVTDMLLHGYEQK
ncbi:TetR family transcriptional regulator [Sporosarcina sp. P21c]|uniref:TetR/AcrR family transcriptional regulator n=1 Tax=Sporosarcina TaxID=1569 RepID=UPI000A16098C|nr:MULTISPECIES: TetR/AcrR family transcriptional regulator [Sporosarcina]ARJ37936.1 TetR family transcriptional regulator [Sporosarcina ureae]PIC67750.1 TetR family transcriptional regulator [Sporosarcina sp. P16a]PIC83743.1 TetR family transcriptional regulator [Sporosarcina sp. P1]PIC90609.1 TetR family transcriptional regulator [Sporosarcina sp. P21c]PIC93375.1 TetR family transcriptional regulator [Sporosarcina sp. P25]